MSGFEIYEKRPEGKTWRRLLDRYAMTDDGSLLIQKADKTWQEVRRGGELFVVPYNKDGDAEVY